MIYLCCDERRRNAVLEHATLNGIHFVEVLDLLAPEGSPRQQTLMLRFLKPVTELNLGAQNILIEGGERVTPVSVLWAASASDPPEDLLSPAEHDFFVQLPDPEELLLVRTDSRGDFSTYTLRLVSTASDLSPPTDIDPLLAQVDFSFKVECPSEFDCLAERICPEEPRAEPDINYLAKDYGSFRRLMLDRMAQLVPDWRERSPADLGIVLVELLAHVADRLSYQQDAVATEAYLDTARRRVSVRRHARLVDYPMHDGSNARAWVHIAVEAAGVALDKGTQLLSRVAGHGPRIEPASRAFDEAMRQRPVVFETMHPVTLHQAHNTLRFYTWGERRCCLPRGATRATLVNHLPDLHARDVLVFEEVLGPETGRPEDADHLKRRAVRLVEVVTERIDPETDEVSGLVDPLSGQAITEVRWHSEDRLPFPLCISARLDDGTLIEDVSVARGNVVLADHGQSISEDLGPAPEPHLKLAPEPSADRCESRERIAVAPRFRPRLREKPLTQAASDPYPELNPQDDASPQETERELASAQAAMRRRQEEIDPKIWLESGDDAAWTPKRDLLGSGFDDPHFVAEVESDGAVYLRFARNNQDEPAVNRHGRVPTSGTIFTANYRVGNGTAGNVGAEALTHVVTGDTSIVSVRNLLPAQGGSEPESIERVRKRTPWAFRTQERAVTPGDYEEMSKRYADVQRAAATFRWTGSWHTAFVTVDRFGGLPVDADFEKKIRAHLEPFRMAGYDLEIDAPRFLPLELELQICVKPDYFRADVKGALLNVLGSRELPDGRRGIFHPDNLTFGQSVHLSTIYAAAQAVPGVDSVNVTRFHPLGKKNPKPLVESTVTTSRLEIARLENDRNYPEHGVIRLDMQGGK